MEARILIAAGLLPAVLALTASAAGQLSFTELMRRAHAYVVVYEDHELSTVIARESYHQQWLNVDGQTKSERTLVSDYLLLQLPPNEDWLALRIVSEVDGMLIADHATRLERLLTAPRDVQSNRVNEILNESVGFNLASDLYYRTVNVPTFALRFLRPASRSRFVFESAGAEQINGVETSVVAYREVKGPTFSGTPKGRDLPAQGRFWIEQESGIPVRSEMILGGTRRMPARVTITVTYALDPALGFRVPIEMRERYDNPREDKAEVIVALATYSDFRRVDATAEVLKRRPK